MHTSLARAICVAFCLCVGTPAIAREWRTGASVVSSNVLIILPGRVSTMDDPTAASSGGSYVEPPPRRYVMATDALAPFRRALRPRGDGMFDFYPRRGIGLRLTAGTRYYRRYGAADDGPGMLAGPIATMRMPGGAVALRYGYERYAPVAMVGYDVALNERITLGVEGGMMSGRANAMYGSTAFPGGPNVARATDNPVADVIVTYRF